jgi:hypothetical protein
MKNIDDAVQENDNNVIIKSSQADVIDLQSEQVRFHFPIHYKEKKKICFVFF